MEEDSYRFSVEEGDLVRLPDGHLADVTDVDIVCGGHVMRVTIRPHGGILDMLRCLFRGWTWWYEGEIDRLTFVSSKKGRETAPAAD